MARPNAAAALLACAVLWDLDVPPEALRTLAAQLGSDVPFALLGGTAVGRGRGEEVMPALARGSYHWVLAFAHHGLSTPAVYRHFDQLNPSAPLPVVPDDLMNALRSGDPTLLGPALSNDLEPAALDLQPQLRRTWKPAATTGPWARWCRARARPVRSWSARRRPRSISA